jgi:hypothetical protein
MIKRSGIAPPNEHPGSPSTEQRQTLSASVERTATAAAS